MPLTEPQINHSPRALTAMIVHLAQTGLSCDLTGLTALLDRLNEFGLPASMSGGSGPDLIEVNGFVFDVIGSINSKPVWQVIYEDTEFISQPIEITELGLDPDAPTRR